MLSLIYLHNFCYYVHHLSNTVTLLSVIIYDCPSNQNAFTIFIINVIHFIQSSCQKKALHGYRPQQILIILAMIARMHVISLLQFSFATFKIPWKSNPCDFCKICQKPWRERNSIFEAPCCSQSRGTEGTLQGATALHMQELRNISKDAQSSLLEKQNKQELLNGSFTSVLKV